ncbi:nuclear transport factor 2 family protein [Amycolatopsis sp. FDAARGOS 1241]|uniref:nuclear transport factor 2 family protein n=1 Tax=Amycolatopsis sp. FDAARGOS 1241 TaxID=2778070 RepID=UPI00195072D1|nr:nuclear transport factor 2 family protein [Amycolatopsis sp. FDAARGOS 1241]QRP49907.1 nuclear transport factor 2 family protein [Amycolatopsis sp. FDAARGOS 1241]
MSTTEDIQELGKRWVAAETAGDTEALDTLATGDFALVGPLGFVLDREQWLGRYRSGALVTHELDWRDVAVREHGDTAIAIGVHDQKASHQGNSVDGQFRATHVLVREDGRWLLAGMHLSPLGAPPAFARGGA